MPLFNLVIKVDEGTIYDVVWDNHCYTCNTNDLCYEQPTVLSIYNDSVSTKYENCKASVSDCKAFDESSFSCDPKFYITWFGTDKNKRQLKSANLAMSKFKQYSIGSLYKSVRDVFNNTMEQIKDMWGDVKETIGNITKNVMN